MKHALAAIAAAKEEGIPFVKIVGRNTDDSVEYVVLLSADPETAGHIATVADLTELALEDMRAEKEKA
jgi:hypothetical protein